MRGRGRASFILRHPLGTLAGLAVALGWGTVAVNAVFLQDGPHPAPLVAPAPTGAVPARVDDASSQDTAGTPGTPVVDEAEREVVRDLQRILGQRGFYDGVADGLPGERTRQAIAAYQRAAGLEETGRHSAALIAHIELSSISNAPLPQSRPGAPADEGEAGAADIDPLDDRPADLGALIDGVRDMPEPEAEPEAEPDGPPVDPVVESVQRILAELGYAPGEIDGQMGPATRGAIERFEADRGMEPRGELTDRLIEELEAVSDRSVG